MNHKNHEFGCAMLNVAFPLSGIHSYIQRAHIYNNNTNDYGLEIKPHVTLLYGLHSNVNPNDVKKAIESCTFGKLTINDISKFESEDYDVLKFCVSGDGLVECNKKLAKLDHTSTFKDYKPHLTVAYIKKGYVDYYINLLKNVDLNTYPISVIYSTSDSNIYRMSPNISFI